MKSIRTFYEQHYHYEEDITVIDKRRMSHFFKSVNLKSVHNYLDIGSGVGLALQYCYERGLNCYGFDISERAIRLSRTVIHPDIKMVVADGERLPFKDESFELVSCLGTLEHFLHPIQGLKEIVRVTKKGGQVLIVVPNSYWLLNKLSLYKGTEQPQETLLTLPQWAKFFQPYLKIKNIDKDIGPKILKNRNIIGIIKRLLLKFTIALPVSFAYQFIFVCIKV